MFTASPCPQISPLANHPIPPFISLQTFVNFLLHFLFTFSTPSHQSRQAKKPDLSSPSRIMPSSQSPAGASQSNAVAAMPGVLPKVALQALEPCAGGFWTVTSQSNDGFSVAYIMNGGTQAISYTMRPCATEEEVLKRCRNHLYDLPQCKYVQPSTTALTDPKKLNSPLSLIPTHDHTSRLRPHFRHRPTRLRISPEIPTNLA